jgi:hypothetical protein
MDRVAMLKLRNEADKKIKDDPELMKKWYASPWPAERELLMTWAIFEIVHARGFDDGWAAAKEKDPEASWKGSVDRMGGSFDDDEIIHELRERW